MKTLRHQAAIALCALGLTNSCGNSGGNPKNSSNSAMGGAIGSGGAAGGSSNVASSLGSIGGVGTKTSAGGAAAGSNGTATNSGGTVGAGSGTTGAIVNSGTIDPSVAGAVVGGLPDVSEQEYHWCCQQEGNFGIDEYSYCDCTITEGPITSGCSGDYPTETCQGHDSCVCSYDDFACSSAVSCTEYKGAQTYGDCCSETLRIVHYSNDNWGIAAVECDCGNSLLSEAVLLGESSVTPTCDEQYPQLDLSWVYSLPTKWSEVDQNSIPAAWSGGQADHRVSSCGNTPMAPPIGGLVCRWNGCND